MKEARFIVNCHFQEMHNIYIQYSASRFLAKTTRIRAWFLLTSAKLFQVNSTNKRYQSILEYLTAKVVNFLKIKLQDQFKVYVCSCFLLNKHLICYSRSKHTSVLNSSSSPGCKLRLCLVSSSTILTSSFSNIITVLAGLEPLDAMISAILWFSDLFRIDFGKPEVGFAIVKHSLIGSWRRCSQPSPTSEKSCLESK